ncbi:Transglutaminase-like superfamily protein [Thermoactinomyces sp. DSM 45891]|uniref:transglutaminase domain-containing protein n=1 Tax=Thermoactinomyces sp. DSM 45891 TaxID=1761907 RepID=UPI00091EAA8D|nr:transglutaminase-like domain-containing protein [Thermoactinomyces sp. DSM 45891]SFX18753.1 Transglutaminase-like superfamily protein [Thermoactinomyces sp. DSM 45891]
MRKLAIILSFCLLGSTLTSCALPNAVSNFVDSIENEGSKKIEYTDEAKKSGFSLEQPTTGIVVGKEEVLIQGSLGETKAGDQIVVRISKDGQSGEKIISIKDKKFRQAVPLFYGKGKHEVQILIPDHSREDYYYPATRFTVENTSSLQQIPMGYNSSFYKQYGVTLEQPIAGGKTYDGKVLLQGSVEPPAKGAKQVEYLVVRADKREDKANYYIPVKDKKFSQWIPLRFGAGDYKVQLTVGDLHYSPVVELKVKNSVTADLRDLLPGSGMESDDPEIISLSKKITANENSPMEKARAIYKYVATNVSYDMKKKQNYWDDGALKTLRERKGICHDYALTTIALLRASEIPARYIGGDAGEPHAWVEAKIGDKWITMDPTWGSGYSTGKKFVKEYNPSYFNPNPASFKKTHKRSEVIY